jgi:hypothetical protein
MAAAVSLSFPSFMRPRLPTAAPASLSAGEVASVSAAIAGFAQSSLQTCGVNKR